MNLKKYADVKKYTNVNKIYEYTLNYTNIF